MNAEQARVLDFWFRELTPADWFGAADSLDPIVRTRFGKLQEEAAAGNLDDWAESPLGRLALIIVLDQFSRHIFRGSAAAFASDERAQKLAVDGVGKGMDEQLSFAQRHFFYMPLMHAESLELQRLSVECFERLKAFANQLVAFAQVHQDEVLRFGRFPRRNAALERLNTDDENSFLSGNRAESRRV
ncbi:DUF924 family protein [Novosphingobium sp. KA1]|uniref:DUF924 family protein n=1 Tax=Novosphingobium sp. (strain KA1) TaxID=164608 RepID=UPI001A8F516C|nr:DUF924 family protein [Novosphingobium sp. KA1]QSR19565.1 hypothetical protein CA833_20615 [Novosphingobium sp. KA1]